jgi:oxygen-independent coproporphyrinogen-3 oxidase
VQSFSDSALKSLGRIHDKSAANRAIECALNLGFNVNVDLMHGLPQQTVAAAMSDLEQALAYPINHLSWYQLTLEPNTQFYRKPPELPAEEVCEIIESEGLAILSSRNFNRYEVSAFAKKGLESQHNLNYWRFGDYLGLGPGAHSKLTLDKSGSNNLHGVIRQVKHRTPGKYLSASQKQSRQWGVEKNELMFEWALNRLRLWDAAISFETYQQDTLDSSSDSLTKFNNAILQACANNWLQCVDNNSKYILTDMGQRYLNDVVLLFR